MCGSQTYGKRSHFLSDLKRTRGPGGMSAVGECAQWCTCGHNAVPVMSPSDFDLYFIVSDVVLWFLSVKVTSLKRIVNC